MVVLIKILQSKISKIVLFFALISVGAFSQERETDCEKLSGLWEERITCMEKAAYYRYEKDDLQKSLKENKKVKAIDEIYCKYFISILENMQQNRCYEYDPLLRVMNFVAQLIQNKQCPTNAIEKTFTQNMAGFAFWELCTIIDSNLILRARVSALIGQNIDYWFLDEIVSKLKRSKPGLTTAFVVLVDSSDGGYAEIAWDKVELVVESKPSILIKHWDLFEPLKAGICETLWEHEDKYRKNLLSSYLKCFEGKIPNELEEFFLIPCTDVESNPGIKGDGNGLFDE